jgi:hypothetical protein
MGAEVDVTSLLSDKREKSHIEVSRQSQSLSLSESHSKPTNGHSSYSVFRIPHFAFPSSSVFSPHNTIPFLLPS